MDVKCTEYDRDLLDPLKSEVWESLLKTVGSVPGTLFDHTLLKSKLEKWFRQHVQLYKHSIIIPEDIYRSGRQTEELTDFRKQHCLNAMGFRAAQDNASVAAMASKMGIEYRFWMMVLSDKPKMLEGEKRELKGSARHENQCPPEYSGE